MLNFFDTQGMIPEIRDGMGGWRQEMDMTDEGARRVGGRIAVGGTLRLLRK